jgi:hypothetical protein
LNATEQDTLVKQIGLALLRAAPRDWRRVIAEYRAVGRYHEMAGEILNEDGTTQEWVATHDIATLFGRLRAGMYRDGRGTWFNARYQLDHPSSYNLEYNRDEPQWDLIPPPQAYSDELRMFPRSEDNVPEWLIRRMSGLAPEQPGQPRFRIARIFDTIGPGGRPVINRPDLAVEEQDRLLDYLDTAPLVVSERGYDVDRFATTPEATVPVAFHSDGLWIWPAAVNFYLRKYGVSPEPDLVEHVRAVGFALREVDDQTLQTARAYLQPPRPPVQAPVPPLPGFAPPPGPPDPQTPPAPIAAPVNLGEQASARPENEPEPPFDNNFDFAEQTQYHDPADFNEPFDNHFDEAEQFAESAHADEVPDEPVPHEMGTNGSEPGIDQATTFTPGPLLDPGAPTMVSPPISPAPPEPPAQVPEPEAQAETTAEPSPPEPALEYLQAKLDELHIPENNYRIGEPAEHGWSVEQVESGWRVGWYDGELSNPAVFGDAEDAAAFMLGKLLLGPGGRPDVAPAEEADAEEEPPPAPVLATLSPELATGAPVSHQREEPPAVTAPPEPAVHGGHDELDDRQVDNGNAAPPPGNLLPPQPVQPPLPQRREPLPPAPTVIAPLPPAPIPAPAPPRREEPVRQAAGQRPAPGGQQQWPIHPMAGEPPLTLFRGKELRELPAGSELDRFGGPNGNLTYAAGTPFEERSLVPEWVNRPYHVYRVQRPFEALAGVAIPWFNQPGGGSAYLLPASIDELVAEGHLLELDPGEPPID